MKWLLFIIVASLPSYLLRFHIGPMPTTALEILILFTFVLWLTNKLRKNELRDYLKNFPRAWLITIFLWLAVATIAVFISPDKRAALGAWRAYFLEPILFLLVFVDVIKTDRDAGLIFSGLGLSAIYISIFAIAQRFFGFPIPFQWQSELRVISVFEYPNAVGLFLAPLVPLLAATGFRVKGLGLRVFYLSTTVLGVVSIILAKSEGAIVGIIAGLFVLGLLWSKKIRIATLVITALLAIMVFSIPQTRSYAIEKATLRDWSGLVRRITWNETIEMLKDRPFAGAGLAGYQKTFAPYHKVTAIEIFMYPHNIILNFWSELGLFGLIVFIWTICLFLIEAKHHSRNKANIYTIAAMVTLIAHGVVDVPYFKNDLSVLFWLIIGLAIAFDRSETSLKHRSKSFE